MTERRCGDAELSARKNRAGHADGPVMGEANVQSTRSSNSSGTKKRMKRGEKKGPRGKSKVPRANKISCNDGISSCLGAAHEGESARCGVKPSRRAPESFTCQISTQIPRPVTGPIRPLDSLNSLGDRVLRTVSPTGWGNNTTLGDVAPGTVPYRPGPTKPSNK